MAFSILSRASATFRLSAPPLRTRPRPLRLDTSPTRSRAPSRAPRSSSRAPRHRSIPACASRVICTARITSSSSSWQLARTSEASTSAPTMPDAITAMGPTNGAFSSAWSAALPRPPSVLQTSLTMLTDLMPSAALPIRSNLSSSSLHASAKPPAAPFPLSTTSWVSSRLSWALASASPARATRGAAGFRTEAPREPSLEAPVLPAPAFCAVALARGAGSAAARSGASPPAAGTSVPSSRSSAPSSRASSISVSPSSLRTHPPSCPRRCSTRIPSRSACAAARRATTAWTLSRPVLCGTRPGTRGAGRLPPPAPSPPLPPRPGDAPPARPLTWSTSSRDAAVLPARRTLRSCARTGSGRPLLTLSATQPSSLPCSRSSRSALIVAPSSTRRRATRRRCPALSPAPSRAPRSSSTSGENGSTWPAFEPQFPIAARGTAVNGQEPSISVTYFAPARRSGLIPATFCLYERDACGGGRGVAPGTHCAKCVAANDVSSSSKPGGTALTCSFASSASPLGLGWHARFGREMQSRLPTHTRRAELLDVRQVICS